MSKIDQYYPGVSAGAQAFHEVKNWAYVRKLIRAAKAGENITPILVDGGSEYNCNLLAGTHRLAANDMIVELGIDCDLIDVVSLDDISTDYDNYDALMDAVSNNDYETIDYLWDRP